MKISLEESLRGLLLGIVYLVGIIGIVASNGGDGDDDETTADIVLAPGAIVSFYDETVTIRVDVENLPADDAISGYTIDLNEVVSGIDIKTRACDPSTGTKFCEIWSITAATTAVPTTYQVQVGAAGSIASIASADLSITVRPPGGYISTLPAVALATGGDHSLAVLTDGTIWGWGHNEDGQLALGSNRRYDRVPVPVQITDGSIAPSAVAAGSYHSLALMQNGTVYAWGRNDDKLNPVVPFSYGQLGIGTAERIKDHPVQVCATEELCAQTNNFLGGVTAIAAGRDHSLALLDDGTVRIWGGSSKYFVDDTTGTFPSYPTFWVSSRVPVRVPDLTYLDSYEQFLANYGCDNYDEQYLRFQDNVALIRNEYLTSVEAIAASGSLSLFLLQDGTVWAWGRRYAKRLGAEHICDPYLDTPRQLPGLNNVSAISAHWRLSLFLKTDGTLWKWDGDNDPVQETTLTDVVALPGGVYALLQDGTVWEVSADEPPAQVPGINGITAADYDRHSLALHSDCPSGGTIEAWGLNGYGQVGNGVVGEDLVTPVSAPVPVLGIGDIEFCDPQRVTVYITGSGTGTVTSDNGTFQCLAEYLHGQLCWLEVSVNVNTLTLTAVPDAGSALSAWSWDCASGGTGLSVALTMDNDKNCMLTFGPQMTLQATAGDGQVTLSWDAEAGATSYNLYWNETGNVTTADNAIIGVTSPYDHSGLTNGTTYYYVFTAVGGSGESQPSSEAFATPTAGSVMFTLELQAYGISGANGNVTSSPAGIDCDAGSPQPNICTHDFMNGTLVRLTAVPVSPSVFDNWAGIDSCDSIGVDGSGFDYCDVTIFQDMSITAIFSPPGP